MGYKRKTFGDGKIYVLSAVGLFAVCAIVGGALIHEGNIDESDTSGYIVDINEEDDSVGINNGIEAEKVTTTTKEEETLKSAREDETTIEDKTEENKGVEENATTGITAEEYTTPSEINNSSQLQQAGVSSGNVTGLTFSKESTFVWPVNGNVIIDYDMDSVVYFPTLDVYKCSDAVCIQSEEGIPVYAGANGTVLEISKNSEIGNYVKMNLGNGYEVTYGSLKDIQVSGGLTVQTGDLIGYVAEPTKYYSVEGANLYIKMTENGNPVDPLEHLNYE